jgi:glycopeptide antibiotics resistance protein
MNSSNLQVLYGIFVQETRGIKASNVLLIIVLAAAVCFIGWVVCNKKKIPFARMIHIYLFLVYMGFLLTITIFRRPIGSREGIIHLFVNLGFGLRTGRPSLYISAFSIFNILLFLPFGIFVSLAIRNKSRSKRVLITTVIGAALSLIIESIQLATGRGMFETTDLLTNTIGSLLGALLVVSVTALFIRNHGESHESFNG